MGTYARPGRFRRRVVNRLAARLGVTVLAVRGRRSGVWRTVPVNVLDHAGARYLVAVRGDTQWARNLRAAGEGELRRRGLVEPFTGLELPAAERRPIIAAYRARWGGVTGRLLDRLPDPAHHPVFRIEPRRRSEIRGRPS